MIYIVIEVIILITFINLASQPKEEIQRVKQSINLTDEEEKIYDMLMKEKSSIEISNEVGLSVRTVFRRMSKIEKKIKQLYAYASK